MIAGSNCPHSIKGWFIPGKSPIAPCDIHRRIWVENHTGLRLFEEPNDSASAHAEVCEFWPSDLAKLFLAAGLPRVAPPCLIDASHASSFTIGNDTEKGPSIVSPRKGLTYHLRVGMADDDVLNLEATTETNHDHLYWFVDAAYLGVSEPSASLLWKLQPGKHIIRAIDDLGRADSREITVTAVE
jgi:penicillin-binding protein 1C